MKRTILSGMTIVLSLPILASCGTAIRSGSSSSPGVEFGALTFTWAQEEDFVVGDARLTDNRFFEDRLHEAIEWELSLRGIRHDEPSPDLLVHHHLVLAGHELAVEAIDQSGYTTTEVYVYEEGTVVVHLVDAETEEDVWVGWAQANIEQAIRGPDDMRTWVYDIVGKMFEGWPAPEFITGTTAFSPSPPRAGPRRVNVAPWPCRAIAFDGGWHMGWMAVRWILGPV